jgi:mono/diheme cytochrome c family protein
MAKFHSHFSMRLALLATALTALPAIASAAQPSLPSGQQLFLDRCASCHGADATGNGPAAAEMTKAPANLTEISKRAGGKFPAAHIVEVITYGGKVADHGSGPMPVWGKVFSIEGGRGKIGAATSRRNVIALKRYLESIQK